MTKILITGAGSVMGQSIFKALAEIPEASGFDLHFSNSDELGAGRYFDYPTLKTSHAPIVPLATSDEYIPFILDYVEKNGIELIYPGTQHELLKLASLREQLGTVACLPAPVTALALDKYALNVALGKVGVAVPRQQLLSDFLVDPAFGAPLIVKPVTNSASRNLFIAKTEAEVPELLQSVRAAVSQEDRAEFVVQGLLDGDEYTCGAYVDRYTGAISTIILRRTLTPDGASGFGVVVEDAAIEAYLRQVHTALRAEGLDFGNFNVQLKLTSAGPVLFEINPRLSSTEAPKARLGFNSCAAFFTNIIKQEPFEGLAPTTGRSFLRFYEEVYF